MKFAITWSRPASWACSCWFPGCAAALPAITARRWDNRTISWSLAVSAALSPLWPTLLIDPTTSAARTLETFWATWGLRSVTVRSITCELPSPLTAMLLPMKLLRFRSAPADWRACATAVRPVARASTWLATASAAALLCGTTLPVMMRADAAYMAGCLVVRKEIATRGTATQMTSSAQYCRSRRAAISSISTEPPRHPGRVIAGRMDKARNGTA